MTFKEFLIAVGREYRSFIVITKTQWRALWIWNNIPEGGLSFTREQFNEWKEQLKNNPLFKADLDKADRIREGKE